MQNKLKVCILLFLIAVFHGKYIEAGELNVVTTLPSLASITQSIGGDYADVYSITRGRTGCPLCGSKTQLHDEITSG